MRSLLRLAASELKLFLREPMVLTFVFAFPVLTVLILGGVFDDDDPNFEGALPSDYYVAAYIGVVVAAIGLVMLPVHLASYRERGVLRRFDVSRYPRWALPAAWILVAMVITAVAVTVLLVTGHLVYGLPATRRPPRRGRRDAARSVRLRRRRRHRPSTPPCPAPAPAQGLGMLLFFPFFLLGGAGPPPDAMGDPMSTIANIVPLTHVSALHPRTMARLGHPHQPPRRARRPRHRRHHRMDHPQHPGSTMTSPHPHAGDGEMVTPTTPQPPLAGHLESNHSSRTRGPDQ